MIPYREASGKACEIGLKLRLLKDMGTFQTLQTWIGHNATRYHNLNALPHALLYIFLSLIWIGQNLTRYHNFNILSHVLSYIFSQLSMV